MIRTAASLLGVMFSVLPSVEGYDESAYVRCETTAGDFTLEVIESWSPHGYKRFMELVDDNFFQNQIIFRAIDGFVFQFGIHPDPEVQKKWQTNYIPDDPARVKFEVGHLSFAGFGEKSRSSHVFIASGKRATRLGKAPHERPLARFHNSEELTTFLEAVNTKHGDLKIQTELVEKGSIAAAAYPDLTVINICKRITFKEAKQIKLQHQQAAEAVANKKEAEKQAELKKQNEVKARKEFVIKRIEAILEANAPKVLKKLPKMLKHWEGKEEGLLENLQKKYDLTEKDEL